MRDRGLGDGVVLLAAWAEDDAGWYAESTRDPLIQRFTTESPTLEAAQVVAAIRRLRAGAGAEGFGDFPDQSAEPSISQVFCRLV